MNPMIRRLLCAVVCLGMLALSLGGAMAEAPAQDDAAVQGVVEEDPSAAPATLQVINETIQYLESRPIVMPVCNVKDGYGIGLHVREEAYQPSTVIISGGLFAEMGMELTSVTVILDNGVMLKGESLVRYADQAPAEGDDSLEAAMITQLQAEMLDIDYTRAGFAFAVDLSGAGLAAGSHEVNVSMMLSSTSVENLASARLTTTINIADDGTFVPDLVYYLTGVPQFVIRNGESGEAVATLQANLVALQYLSEEAQSGVYDEATQNALRELCASNDQAFNEEGVTAALDKFIVSGYVAAKETEPAGWMEKVLAFLNSPLILGSLELPYWVLIAAAAGLIVIVVMIILIVKAAGKKKADASMGASYEGGFEQGFRTSMDEESGMNESNDSLEGGIINTGDEETKDMSELEPMPQGNPSVVIAEDEATIDQNEVVCHLRVQMYYKDMVKETAETFSNQKQLVIGVGEAANIRTNPADKKVSRLHGVFEVKDGCPCYTDRSKNGTIVNGASELHHDTIGLKVGVLYQLEMGEHIVRFKLD